MQASEQDRVAGAADDDARALVRERVTQLRRSGALATGTGPEHDEARAFVRARLAQLRQASPTPRVASGPHRATTLRPVATARPARPATSPDPRAGEGRPSGMAPADDTGPVGLPRVASQPVGGRAGTGPDWAPPAERHRDAADTGPLGAVAAVDPRAGDDAGPGAPRGSAADPAAARPPVPMPGVTADALRARRAARSASPAAALVAPGPSAHPTPGSQPHEGQTAPATPPTRATQAGSETPPTREGRATGEIQATGEVQATREGRAARETQAAREGQAAGGTDPTPQGQATREGRAVVADQVGSTTGGTGAARAESVEPPPVPGIDERADALFDDTVVLPRRREVHQGRRRTAVPWAAAVAAIAVLGGSGIGVTAMNAGGLDLLGARPVPTPTLAAAPPVTASPSTSPSPSPSPTETVAAAPSAAEQAPPPPPPPTTHTVGPDDTLQSIALQFGLDPDDGWRRLFDANPEIERPELLPVGLVLRIPDAAEVLTPRALPTQEPTPEPTEEASAAEEETEEAPADDAPAVPSDSVWDQLAQCESGGNWSINTGNGYYGGLQFSASSWRAVGGTGLPHQHSREEQIRRGELLQDAQGWGAWPTCARKLGLL